MDTSQALAQETTRKWLEAICPVGSQVKVGSCRYEVLGYTDEKVLLRTPFEMCICISLDQFEEQAELP